MIRESFEPPLNAHWTQTCIGGGELVYTPGGLRLGFNTASQGRYTDAQIDDYGQSKRADFPWRPPLRMQIEARSFLPGTDSTDRKTSGILQGTAGFGFWNYPFSVRGDILMLPEAVWFFYASPPSNMALVPGIPGYGWKAQVVHAMRPAALFSTLPLGLATGLALLTGKTGPAGRWLQRLTGTHECVLTTALHEWHTYTLEWTSQEARFHVDGEEVLKVANPPARPLGFVAWLDNQYAIVTPRGHFRFGTVASGEQWLEIARLQIEPLR